MGEWDQAGRERAARRRERDARRLEWLHETERELLRAQGVAQRVGADPALVERIAAALAELRALTATLSELARSP